MIKKVEANLELRDFEVDFQSPEFALRVGGTSKKECEETFFAIFDKVTKNVNELKQKTYDGMMHR